MKRSMGLDYGARTVGIALSDGLGITAQPLETIWRKEENKLRKTCARIEELIRQYDVDCLVLGKPVHMDGSAGERMERCMEFKEMLERRTGKEVFFWDERLTTVASDEILAESGIKPSERKQYIDAVAASLILKEFMEASKDGKGGLS